MPGNVSPLTVHVHEVDQFLGLTGLCAGFESGAWRAEVLAEHLMSSLPEFCLTHGELQGIGPSRLVPLVREAARRVYQTANFGRRGEFGELMLHVVLREVFQTIPAISKLYYKDSVNGTVKGFDAVHVIATESALQLWLGEAKFYRDIAEAIRDASEEIQAHTQAKYLRNEFLAIKSKVETNWHHADRLRRLLDPNTSLDEVFDALCIPVLLTYDGAAIASVTETTADYREALVLEFQAHREAFRARGLPANVHVHLFLVPLKTKETLIAALDAKLRVWQQI